MRDDRTACALQLCEPELGSSRIDAAARLAHGPRRMMLMYYKHGLISPVQDPASAGYPFTAEAVRGSRRIERVRAECQANMAGIRRIHDLMNEVERLRAAVRNLRG